MSDVFSKLKEVREDILRSEKKFIRAPCAVCCIIDINWWKKWCKYIGLNHETNKELIYKEGEGRNRHLYHPGPVNNSALSPDLDPLKYVENYHYVVKSYETWAIIKQFYPASGPEIFKKLDSHGCLERPIKVVVYYTGPLLTKFCQVCVPSVLRDFYRKSKGEIFTNADNLLTDFPPILPGQHLMLEPKDECGSNYEDQNDYYDCDPPDSLEDEITPGNTSQLGVAGLANLGNTCYMNSSIQCLIHSVPIIEIFLSGIYKQQKNTNNPLGHNGVFADGFGELMKKLYMENVSYITPHYFKKLVGKCHCHFEGHDQHDGQEFIAFLLDALHEDLNRVQKKPYVENKNLAGMSDKEMTEHAWKMYKLRNDSFISDYFQGLYRSTLSCSLCDYKSVTMEPFNCLSLPLPGSKFRDMSICVLDMSGTEVPVDYTIRVPIEGRIGEVYKSLAVICEIPVTKARSMLLITEVRNGQTYKRYLDNQELIVSIRNHANLIGYRYAAPEYGPGDGKKELNLMQRSTRDDGSFDKFIGPPLIFWMPFGIDNPTYSQIEERVKSIAQLYEKPPGVQNALETALRPIKRSKKELISAEIASDATCVDTESERYSECVEPECSTSVISADNHKRTRCDSSYSVFPADQYGEPLYESELEYFNSNTLHFVISWSLDSSSYYDHDKLNRPIRKVEEEKEVELYECIEMFLEDERLDSSDLWECDKCKQKNPAVKKLDLLALPELKRFSFDQHHRSKLRTPVLFPTEGLDLNKYLPCEQDVPPIYDLYAVSNHYGNLQGGHYTAFCKLYDTQEWQNMDDTSVNKIEDMDLEPDAAYVLFYHRRHEYNQKKGKRHLQLCQEFCNKNITVRDIYSKI